jgi:hypothetical protein
MSAQASAKRQMREKTQEKRTEPKPGPIGSAALAVSSRNRHDP